MKSSNLKNRLSRRGFLQSSLGVGAALAVRPLWGLAGVHHSGPAHRNMAFDYDWQFLGKAAQPSQPVTFSLPHTVAKLSWQDWNAGSWEDVWLYRKAFNPLPDSEGLRTFLKFDGAMVTADVNVNGTALPQHKGGYLPFSYEITSVLKPENVVEVRLDSRFQNVPPEGNPKGTHSVDYFVPGGLIRGASLYAVPQTYISDVFAKPIDVLQPSRRVDITCTLDSASGLTQKAYLEATILDGERVVAKARKDLATIKQGTSEVTFSVSGLHDVKLWDNDNPHLYNVVVTLHLARKPVHDYRTRIGFREAKFTVDGFFLNGKKMQFFGLNRHEIYPYVGYSMPERVMRKDAEIIRHNFNCNTVRCSHYPQHEAFLDACDELGLMVWEETPGWGYVGADKEFEDEVLQNVKDMIRRDRNHASIIIWGVRVNESHNNPLYIKTTAAAKELDDSRPDSGSMTYFGDWKTTWHEDVFSYDDYHQSPDGTVQITAPLEGIPYMLSETVGQRTYTKNGFDNKYRRSAEPSMQYHQAIYHAQAHDRARAYDRMSGVIAWCAFEYGSPQNSYKGIKNPGIADVFRVPKLGATFYQSQVSPSVRPVIAPNFYWDFGTMTPQGPGKDLAIFHNCDRIEVFVDGKQHASLEPDRKGYPHLLHAPSWVDLELDGSSRPELRIDGFVNGHKVLTRQFSSDPAHDQFVVAVDDAEIHPDGIDATRITFQVQDKYGAPRYLGGGDVRIEISGPGVLIGDETFSLTDSGGVGAVWIKSTRNATGVITVKLTHSTLGSKTTKVTLKST